MTEQTKQPKPNRRWLRFSLRTFLVVLTILCVGIGWYVYRVEQQREAVKWVLENGGTVGYAYEYNPDEWLHNLLGMDYCSNVFEVALCTTQVTDLTPLAGLQNLEHLYLDGTRIPINGLRSVPPSFEFSDVTPLARLKNLESLSIEGSQVNDLSPLTGLTNLKRLSLNFTPISDVTPLANLTNLEALEIGYTQVSDLAPLAGLSNLKYLTLIGTDVSDLIPLVNLTKLWWLDIRQTQVSDEEIEKLKIALPNCTIYIGQRPPSPQGFLPTDYLCNILTRFAPQLNDAA